LCVSVWREKKFKIRYLAVWFGLAA